MSLARLNRFLVIAILTVNTFVLALPLLPHLWLWTQQARDIPAKMESRLKSESPSDIPKTNRLLIPKIALDEQIHEGPDEAALRHGLWRRPHTSTPQLGSNTVITGHRFTYTDPVGTFYHLDKLSTGDTIGIYWEKQKHTYTVRETKVVPSNAVHIENATDTELLTLYTCTPLWNPVERLVVIAEKTNIQEELLP